MKVHNRWVQLCAASSVAMIMIANLQYAWTLFVKPMQAATGWKLSEISARLHAVHPLPDVGAAARRLARSTARAARFITAAGVLCGVGWAGDGSASVRCRCSTRRHIAARHRRRASSTAGRSARRSSGFSDRRGLAAGIMAAGFGGGTALFIPVIGYAARTERLSARHVRRHRHLPGPGHRDRRAVADGIRRGSRGPREVERRRLARRTTEHFTTPRDAAHAAVLRDVRAPSC